MALSVWKFHRIVFLFCKSLISYIHVVQLNSHHASSARHILNICYKQTSSWHSRPVTSQTSRGLMHLNTNKRRTRDDDERLFRGSGATGEPAASQWPFSRTTWIRNNVKTSTAISLLKAKRHWNVYKHRRNAETNVENKRLLSLLIDSLTMSASHLSDCRAATTEDQAVCWRLAYPNVGRISWYRPTH